MMSWVLWRNIHSATATEPMAASPTLTQGLRPVFTPTAILNIWAHVKPTRPQSNNVTKDLFVEYDNYGRGHPTKLELANAADPVTSEKVDPMGTNSGKAVLKRVRAEIRFG